MKQSEILNQKLKEKMLARTSAQLEVSRDTALINEANQDSPITSYVIEAKRKHSTYTVEQKEKAVSMLQTSTVPIVSEKLGIPKATLYDWKNDNYSLSIKELKEKAMFHFELAVHYEEMINFRAERKAKAKKELDKQIAKLQQEFEDRYNNN